MLVRMHSKLEHELAPPHANGGSMGNTSLLGLPAELLLHIISFLQLSDVLNVSRTCRRLHHHGYDEQIWLPLVNQNLHSPITKPGPAKSFRDLYIAHHPNWFLTRNRVWFGNSEPSGKLLISRYDEERGWMEAYTVVATRGDHNLSFWERKGDVIIHSFDPQISLDLHLPVVRLKLDSPRTEDAYSSSQSQTSARSSQSPQSSPQCSKEVLMDAFVEPGLNSSFMLCRTLPESAISSATAVWPPLRFPADTRTRIDSRDRFTSRGHRPTRVAEISQNNFRIRKWVEFTGRRSSPTLAILGTGTPPHLRGGGGAEMMIRVPEDIPTYASLPESCYIPTAQKPYQGIWCGDYSGHGCEFLVITQPDRKDERPLPEGIHQCFRSRSRSESASSSSSFVSAVEDHDSHAIVDPGNQPNGASVPIDLLQGFEENGNFNSNGGNGSSSGSNATAAFSRSTRQRNRKDVPTGRLEAIKLTGDPNIPRGEYTFVAPDIGHAGFVRVADEQPFLGARVVRSAGHVAGRGFRRDHYTSSQLFLLSHNRLAQYWESFGHISYFQRVDLDALVRYQA